MRTAQSKIESIKNWSISTYKCTRQLMYEKLGKTSRTVDSGKLHDLMPFTFYVYYIIIMSFHL